ncbi:glycyl-radical enzyme activating protein [Leptolinea tardivitalis]|uniref:Pyruvate formate lyase-activating protein n=1 Tax=Leptolinea tardivitalis TaxID=229920 RepID=A0A0P6WYR0_9CHLR|nr:glycyl-radical enzyme activating protein [Leptolinea tardivitalis]KPL71779.1 hypothetical protein ADM99_10100 [Leptolinea tardivitalis]GAP20155.1 glycerol dehydratase, cobalamin-independent, small subunit [Leptolinea tardivitalis]
MKGLVFDLQRYSIHDGPGIRTVVFLKGCPLDCPWCCNPESQNPEQELEFRSSLCQQCGTCISVCPSTAINLNVQIDPLEKIDRSLCTLCEACIQACPSRALRISGTWMETSDVLAQCLKDADTYRRSGGGITLSGGEPLYQPDFSLDLLQSFYNRNIHTAMETTGYAPWDTIEAFLPVTDLFLFDIKHTNPEKHNQLTGVPNTLILENLVKLCQNSATVVIRFPVIPGLNDDDENILAIMKIATDNGINQIHLMPYHQFGREKYRRLGRSYPLETNPLFGKQADLLYRLEKIHTMYTQHGIDCQVGG